MCIGTTPLHFAVYEMHVRIEIFFSFFFSEESRILVGVGLVSWDSD